MTSEPHTTVHLLRHGEVHNPEGVLYGRLPGYQLSPDGVRMAEAAADALAGRDIRLLVSSPLERARQTAAPVAAALDLPVAIDERLVESLNAFEGRTFGVGGGSFRHPAYWRYLYNPFRPSWGESYRDIAARMLAAVEAARDAVLGHEAVCVSHQLPIWTVRRAAENRTLWHRPDVRQCGLASLSSITWHGDRIVMVTYSEPAGAAARKPVVAGA